MTSPVSSSSSSSSSSESSSPLSPLISSTTSHVASDVKAVADSVHEATAYWNSQVARPANQQLKGQTAHRHQAHTAPHSSTTRQPHRRRRTNERTNERTDLHTQGRYIHTRRQSHLLRSAVLPACRALLPRSGSVRLPPAARGVRRSDRTGSHRSCGRCLSALRSLRRATQCGADRSGRGLAGAALAGHGHAGSELGRDSRNTAGGLDQARGADSKATEGQCCFSFQR